METCERWARSSGGDRLQPCMHRPAKWCPTRPAQKNRLCAKHKCLQCRAIEAKFNNTPSAQQPRQLQAAHTRFYARRRLTPFGLVCCGLYVAWSSLSKQVICLVAFPHGCSPEPSVEAAKPEIQPRPPMACRPWWRGAVGLSREAKPCPGGATHALPVASPGQAGIGF